MKVGREKPIFKIAPLHSGVSIEAGGGGHLETPQFSATATSQPFIESRENALRPTRFRRSVAPHAQGCQRELVVSWDCTASYPPISAQANTTTPPSFQLSDLRGLWCSYRRDVRLRHRHRGDREVHPRLPQVQGPAEGGVRDGAPMKGRSENETAFQNSRLICFSPVM